MQLANKSGLVRIVLITAVLFSIFFLISTVSPNLDVRALFQGDGRNLIAVVALAVLFHFFLEPLRWFLYADGARFAAVFAVLSTTALFSYTLPFKLGLPTRIYLVTEHLGLSAKRTVFFLTADAAINLGSWGVFGAAAFVYLLPVAEILSSYAYLLVAVLVVMLMLYLLRGRILKLFRPLLDKEFEISKRTIALSGIIVYLDVLGFGLRHVAIFAFLGLPVSYLDGFLIGILSVFAGIASMLPLGLGAYDAALIFLLAAQGVPVGLASLAPVLNRSLNLLSSMLFGGLGSVYLLRHPSPQCNT